MASEEQIRKMYESSLGAQKNKLQADYESAATDLDVQKEKNQQATDANLNMTAVEAQRRAMNDAEYYAASGLTSGAKAQARIARENQLASDMSAIRAAQQMADAEIERDRGLLAKEYNNAIRQAQENNDLALAEALYDQARYDEEQMRTGQLASAKMLAEELGDYTELGRYYNWSPEVIEYLNELYGVEKGDPTGDPPRGSSPVYYAGGTVPNLSPSETALNQSATLRGKGGKNAYVDLNTSREQR